MAGLFLMFLLILVVAGFAIGSIYLLYNLLLNFQPGNNQVRKDLHKLRSELRLFIDDLVPWNQEEMDLLSLNHTNKKVTRGVSPTAKGIITSIYHEPMIAWSYKRYYGQAENSILFAASSNREFVFRNNKGETIIEINNQLVGTLRENGILYSAKTNRLLARINRPQYESMFPVLIGEKEVASIVDPVQGALGTPRAFQFVADMTEEEEAVLLALTVLELVKPELPKK